MFSCPISGLSNNTTYYVRIAVTNGGSVYYSPQKTFTTISQLPVVYTGGAGIVTNNSAIIYNNYVESDDGSAVINRGIKYSTNSNPIEYGDTAHLGSGTGYFDVELTGLMSYATYYYCAFATNSYGTSYGAIRSFTTGYY